MDHFSIQYFPITLNEKIRHFYDTSTNLWLDTWGEHMHHGYYGADGKEHKDHRQAQIDLIDELLIWGNVNAASHILDAGCGVGGSARYLARRFNAKVLGLTISPVQANAARTFNHKAGLGNQVNTQVGDMLSLSANEGPFDLIWSLESAEHIPDKKKLLNVFLNVLKPGGKLIIATWCHRELHHPLQENEKEILASICRMYHLPPLISLSQFRHLMEETGYTTIESVDWSESVTPFWHAVIRSAFSLRGFSGLLRAGWPAIKGAWAMQYMVRGYRMETIRFGLLQAQKP